MHPWRDAPVILQDNKSAFLDGLFLAWLQQLEQEAALFVEGFEVAAVR